MSDRLFTINLIDTEDGEDYLHRIEIFRIKDKKTRRGKMEFKLDLTSEELIRLYNQLRGWKKAVLHGLNSHKEDDDVESDEA